MSNVKRETKSNPFVIQKSFQSEINNPHSEIQSVIRICDRFD